MDPRTKRALVTGGAVRIGRVVCLALAKQGYDIIIHYNHSEEEANGLEKDLNAAGVFVWKVAGDLSEKGAADRIVSRAWDASGGFNVLINNAAVFDKETLFEADAVSFVRELRVNFAAPLLLSRAFAERILAEDKVRGSIVNLLDRRITGIDTACMPYEVSKKMLEEATVALAAELAPRIAVNGVAPGAVLPPVRGGAAKPVKDLAGPVPLETDCTPVDVAEGILFLLKSSAITGQILFVDGGQHLSGFPI